MLEERIHRATELAVERLTEGMETVEFGQIRHRGFFPALVRRLTVSADRVLEEERARRAASPMNYAHPRVKALVERLDGELRDTVMFSKEEIAQLVEDQIRWDVLLRLRPVEAISKLVFSKQLTLSFEYVLHVFSTLDIDSLYVDAVRSVSEGHLQRRVNREELTAILRRAEDQTLEGGVVVWVMARAASVMEILRHRKIAEGDEIDLDVLEQILRYRGLEDLERLIRVERLLGRGMLTFGQARRILEMREQAEGEQGEVFREPEGDLSMELWEAGLSGKARDQKVEDSQAAHTPDQKEGERSVSLSRGTPEVVRERKAVEQDAKPSQMEKAEAEDQVTKPFEIEEVEVSPSVPLRSMEEVIGWRDEKYFIRKLFGKDRELYGQLIAQLDKMATWEAAQDTIERFWGQYGIDGGSKVAAKFSNAVYARYES